MKKEADFPSQLELPEDFNINDKIKTPNDALNFLMLIVASSPGILPNVLGYRENEMFKIIKSNIPEVEKRFLAHSEQLPEERKQSLTKQINALKNSPSFEDLIINLFTDNKGQGIDLLGAYFKGIPTHAALPTLLGTSGEEILKRLLTYLPQALHPTKLEDILKGEPAEEKSSIDTILDQYKAKQIDKPTMERMMREFTAKHNMKVEFIKQANNKLKIKISGK